LRRKRSSARWSRSRRSTTRRTRSGPKVRYTGLMAPIWTGDPARRPAGTRGSERHGRICMSFTAPRIPTAAGVRLRPRARPGRRLYGDSVIVSTSPPFNPFAIAPADPRYRGSPAGTTAQADFSALLIRLPVLRPGSRPLFLPPSQVGLSRGSGSGRSRHLLGLADRVGERIVLVSGLAPCGVLRRRPAGRRPSRCWWCCWSRGAWNGVNAPTGAR
jgi:hypothetical protein